MISLYARKARYGRLYNWGGDSDSDSSTNTNAYTTNNATSTDKRSVASDDAVSTTGDNNTIDRSTTSLTNFFDSSDHSTSSITSFLDKSTTDNSTTFTDNSNRSSYSSNVTTLTDYGSVNGALASAGTMSTKAFDVAGEAIKGAIDTLQYQTATGLDLYKTAFGQLAQSAADGAKNNAQLLGFATQALDSTSAAISDAKDGGQSKMVTYAIAAVAVVGVAFALKR